jgi:hypothetical protein
VIPLGGALWFAAWRRYLRRLEREGTLAYNAGAR